MGIVKWPIYYIRRISILTAHRKEVGRLWHCSKVDTSCPQLFGKKGCLLKPLVKEFAAIWRFCPWICTCHVTSYLNNRHVGDGGFDQICLFLWRIRVMGGGWMAWVAILTPPPHIGNSSFSPLCPYLHDIFPFFLMSIVPLDTAHLFDSRSHPGMATFSCSALKAVLSFL